MHRACGPAFAPEANYSAFPQETATPNPASPKPQKSCRQTHGLPKTKRRDWRGLWKWRSELDRTIAGEPAPTGWFGGHDAPHLRVKVQQQLLRASDVPAVVAAIFHVSRETIKTGGKDRPLVVGDEKLLGREQRIAVAREVPIGVAEGGVDHRETLEVM